MKKLLLTLLFILSIGQVVAQNYLGIESLWKKPTDFDLMRDYSSIISEKKEGQLREKLHEYNQRTTTQIQIITIPSLENYPIDTLSLQVANLWGIGQAKKNNGVLILLATNEQKIKIEIGKGIKKYITEEELTAWLNQITPLLKNQDFYSALDQLTTNFTQKLGNNFAPKGFEKLGSKEIWTFILFGVVFFFMGGVFAGDGRFKFSFIFLSIWLVIGLTILFVVEAFWIGLIMSGITQGIFLFSLIWWKNEKEQQKIQSEKREKVIKMIEDTYQIYNKHEPLAAQNWKTATEKKLLKKRIEYNEIKYAEEELKKSQEFEQIRSYLTDDTYWKEAEKFYTLLPNLVSEYRESMMQKFVTIPYKEKYKVVYFENMENRLRLPFLPPKLSKKLEPQQIKNWLKHIISNNNLESIYPAKLKTKDQRKQEREFLKQTLKTLEDPSTDAINLFLNLRNHWEYANTKKTSVNSLLNSYKSQNNKYSSSKNTSQDNDDDDYYRDNNSNNSSHTGYGGGSFDGDGAGSDF
ncbi:TPM domain-containing protein [Bernardetia sp.]|uniref:TPM domain-containing protein n=1 Tax=Bernardetia sp. TaxID=1937974 RepID=UPI0025BAB68C|nr:TPM domain-containing protein [Bernardetia sp.]